MICFRCARLGHTYTSCWDSNLKSEPNKFRQIIATPLHLRTSFERKNKLKGKAFGSTAKNLLSDLEAQAAQSHNSEGERALEVASSCSIQPEGKGKNALLGITPTEKEPLFPNWSASEFDLFGMQLLNKGDPMLSIARNFGVTLNPKTGIVVNLKRTKVVSAGSEQNAAGSMQTPKRKFGPKRNGPGPAWRQSKQVLGLEPPCSAVEKSVEESSEFTDQEEETPTQWLCLGNGSIAGSNTEYDPSEHTANEVCVYYFSLHIVTLSQPVHSEHNHVFVPHTKHADPYPVNTKSKMISGKVGTGHPLPVQHMKFVLAGLYKKNKSMRITISKRLFENDKAFVIPYCVPPIKTYFTVSYMHIYKNDKCTNGTLSKRMLYADIICFLLNRELLISISIHSSMLIFRGQGNYELMYYRALSLHCKEELTICVPKSKLYVMQTTFRKRKNKCIRTHLPVNSFLFSSPRVVIYFSCSSAAQFWCSTHYWTASPTSLAAGPSAAPRHQQ